MPRKHSLAAACGLVFGASVALAVPFPGNAELLSVAPDGAQGNEYSYEGCISDNGRIAVFYSPSTNWSPDANGEEQIWVSDRRRGTLELVSRDGTGAPGVNYSYYPAVSANGRWILYSSTAPNVTGDSGNTMHVMLHDRATGETRLVSRTPGGSPGNERSRLYDTRPLSADGRYAAFVSRATDLVPGDENGFDDAFLADLRAGAIRRISNGIGGESDGPCDNVSISPNGRWVLFTSRASNLVENDANGTVGDVFLHDRKRGTTRLVSLAADGSAGNAASGTYSPAISANGRWLAFESAATNLGDGTPDAAGRPDIFLKDLKSGAVRRLSLAPGGAVADDESADCGIDPKGRVVSWWTRAKNLVPAPSTLNYEQIWCDVATGELARMVSAAAGGEVPSSSGNYGYWNQLSANGRWFVATVGGDAASPEDENGEIDVYLVDLKKKAE